MAFTLPDLPYSHDALAGLGMSAETLEYHHDLHHNAYVVNGNKLIAGTEWEGKSLEDIITGTYDSSAVAQNGIFNNASQHWNHMKFWEMMGSGETGMPSELEADLIAGAPPGGSPWRGFFAPEEITGCFWIKCPISTPFRP